MQPTTIQFTGQHTGDQVSLSLTSGGLWQGTLVYDVLTLRIPQSDGAIQEATFIRGGIDSFNAAVTRLQTSAGATQSSNDAAKVAADRAARLAQARQNLAGDSVSLREAVGKLPNALAAYDAAAKGGMNDARAKLDAAIAARPLDCGNVGYELSNVSYARSNVSYQDSNLSYYLNLVDGAMQSVSGDEATLISLDPAASLDDADSALNAAAKAVAGAKTQAASDDNAADAVVDDATRKGSAVCPQG